MLTVSKKVSHIDIGRERFLSGAALPEHIANIHGAELLRLGVVVSDEPKPKRSRPDPEPKEADPE